MANRALNKELKQKLESHKKWLEEQINSNEYDSRDRSRNPEDALEEIANNSAYMSGPYKPSYPTDEHLQQYEKAEDNIFQVSGDQKKVTADPRSRSKPGEGKSLKPQSSQMKGKKSSSLATPIKKKQIDSPRSGSKGSGPRDNNENENNLEKIEFYGRLSGNKQLDELLLRNKKLLENKNWLMQQRKPDNQPDEECTFKPRLNPRPAYKKYLPFEERNKNWSSQKVQNLESNKKKDEDKDLKGCTFHPDVNYNANWNINPSATALASKGTDKFLRRQLIARQQKEEKDTILSNPLAKTTTHKSQGFTIPRSPFFGTIELEEKTLNSLKKPLNPEYFEEYSSAKLRINDQSLKDSPQRAREAKYAEKLHHIMDQKAPGYLQVNNVTYGKAVNILHKQLNRMDIAYE